jgi:butyrate kinase
MPKGKYKRLACHKNILKKNLKHKKLNLREAKKIRFRYEFKKLLRERIKNINITDDKLDELISTNKTYSEVKEKYQE